LRGKEFQNIGKTIYFSAIIFIQYSAFNSGQNLTTVTFKDKGYTSLGYYVTMMPYFTWGVATLFIGPKLFPKFKRYSSLFAVCALPFTLNMFAAYWLLTCN